MRTHRTTTSPGRMRWTFAAGEDRKTISVSIVDDAVREDPVNGFHENFWVIVGSGEGYTRGGYAIVEIVDNDGDARRT